MTLKSRTRIRCPGGAVGPLQSGGARAALVLGLVVLALPAVARAAEPGTDAAQLHLELDPEDLERLRSELERDPLPAPEGAVSAQPHKRVEVRGWVSADGQRVKVKLSLLREWSERLETGRWPLAVRTRGDAYLFGIERFSLRAPAVRGYQAEILMLEHLRREGVLAPRVMLVNVSMNGDDVGLMKFHEALDTELIEAQRRRKGAILRFENEAATLADAPGLSQEPDAFRARPLVFEREGRSSRTPALAGDRRLAVGLLGGFLEGSLAAREVFDIDLVARFLAVCELWRAVDALRWPNLRFYFNPVTKLLEPIGSAASPPDLFLDEGLVATSEAWPAALLRDAALRSAFERHVVRLARETVDGVTAAWLRAIEAPLLVQLRAENPEHPAVPLEAIAARAKRLIVAAPVAMATLSAETVAAAPAISSSSLRNPVPSATREEALAAHPFLRVDAESGDFAVATGSWVVDGSLVLPDGAGLRMGPGTTLRFAVGELMLVNGPLDFLGTAQAPVVLEGAASGETRGGWQGLVVLHSERSHHWEHVQVRDTAGIERDGWKLTGGITFRESELILANSQISGSRAEDALNVIRSRFELRNVDLTDARSDGFDSDFSSGLIEGGRFSGIGGDAIDVSGTTVTVSGVRIENVRDKALSVGEGSHLTARGIRIESVGTGMASKDGSEVLVEDSQLCKVTYAALMAYVKKNEYGPARLVARNVVMKKVGRPALAQLGSQIEIDGELQVAEKLDVDELYTLGPMKK
jgi:hypothetical protein